MESGIPQINAAVGWLWILIGFISGLLLGLGFHRENWLGGYGSLKRRMYRLAHIAFFGLGAVNLLFFLTVRDLGVSPGTQIAGTAFVVGAVLMPLCCVLMAHWHSARLLFAFPVVALVLGGIAMAATTLSPPARSEMPKAVLEPANVSGIGEPDL